MSRGLRPPQDIIDFSDDDDDDYDNDDYKKKKKKNCTASYVRDLLS